jgi:hypothetical protein
MRYPVGGQGWGSTFTYDNNAVVDMAILELKSAKVTNNLVPSVQQPAVSAVCFDTFCDKYIFYDKMAGGQF